MSSAYCHWFFIRGSMGTVALCLTETFFSPQELPSEMTMIPSPRVCPYPLKRQRAASPLQQQQQQQQQQQNLHSVRCYLQRRKPDSQVIVAGKTAVKYFYRFVYFSNHLDVAASKLNSLTSDDFGASAAKAYVAGSDPEPFFEQLDVLLQGTDQEKQVALQLLKNASSKVGCRSVCLSL